MQKYGWGTINSPSGENIAIQAFCEYLDIKTQYDEADLNKSQKSRVKIDGFLHISKYFSDQ